MLIGTLLIVKDKEECVRVKLFKEAWVFKDGQGLLWIIGRGRMRCGRLIEFWPIDRVISSASEETALPFRIGEIRYKL